MSSLAAQIEALRSQTLTQLEDLLDNPEPTYSINGQEISWMLLLESLQQTVDWCTRKLAECEPFEVHSEGGT